MLGSLQNTMASTVLYLLTLVSCVLIKTVSAECKLGERTLSEGERYENCTEKCRCVYGNVNCEPAVCPPTQPPSTPRCVQYSTRVLEGQCCPVSYCEHCDDRWYGSDCSKKCGQCASGRCDIDSGACTPNEPLCLPGFVGDTCTAGCGDGFYGPDCLERCGACASGKCRSKTGVCKPDEPLCKSGYTGNRCLEACPVGRFGPECAWECGGCATGQTTCKAQTGQCPEADPRCTPGHMGPWCKACDAGTWGMECQQNCSKNCARGVQECDRRDGTCVGGCLPGFDGYLCESAMQLSTVVGIGVGIGLFVLVVIVACTIICLYCKRRPRRQDSLSRNSSYLTPVTRFNGHVTSGELPAVHQTDEYELPMTMRSESFPVYISPDPPAYCTMDLHGAEDELIYEMMLPRTNWNVNLAEFDVGNKVMTQGNFGETQLALWNHNADKSLCTQVGLKRFPGSGSGEMKNLINSELEKLRSMDRCISVLAVLGASADPTTGDTFLILECTEKGSLLSYLKQNRFESSRKEELTEKRLTKLCQDVAYGMEQISSYSITNVDLAANTILLDKHLNAKITGMVHFREKDLSQDQIRERQRWDALETLSHDQHTVHSDVWRYGVLMWEVFSLGETPYSDTSVKDLHRKLETGCRLGHPTGIRNETYVLMTECWDAEPTSRPAFGTIVSRLREVQQGIPSSHNVVPSGDGLYWTVE